MPLEQRSVSGAKNMGSEVINGGSRAKIWVKMGKTQSKPSTEDYEQCKAQVKDCDNLLMADRILIDRKNNFKTK